MFNEILTGQASNEPKLVSADPYRQESIPQITLTCVDCAKTYQANVGTQPGRCGPCHVRIAEANAAASARAFAEAREGVGRRVRSQKLVRTVLVVGCGLLLAMFKLGMRHQYREDMRAAQGASTVEVPASFDPFVEKIGEFASTVCTCRDLACAAPAKAAFDHWSRTTEAPTDSAVLDAAAAATARLTDCYDKLRSAPPR